MGEARGIIGTWPSAPRGAVKGSGGRGPPRKRTHRAHAGHQRSVLHQNSTSRARELLGTSRR